jgi:hypothetical protein
LKPNSAQLVLEALTPGAADLNEAPPRDGLAAVKNQSVVLSTVAAERTPDRRGTVLDRRLLVTRSHRHWLPLQLSERPRSVPRVIVG